MFVFLYLWLYCGCCSCCATRLHGQLSQIVRFPSPSSIYAVTRWVGGLIEFAKKPPHERKLLELKAWLQSPTGRSDVNEVFLLLDKSNTGVIRRDDMITVLTQFSVHNDECHAIYEALDPDKKGYIEYSKFLAATAVRQDHNEQLSRRTFERLDADMNEIYTPEERSPSRTQQTGSTVFCVLRNLHILLICLVRPHAPS